MSGETIIASMKPMRERSNGLGGEFAAYGIYPEYLYFFRLHMFLDDRAARKNCKAFLRETMEIVHAERYPYPDDARHYGRTSDLAVLCDAAAQRADLHADR